VISKLIRVRARLAPQAPVEVTRRLELIHEALGRAEIQRRIDGPQLAHIRDYGVRVFAQWDEDGILAYLLHVVGHFAKRFVEIGVEDYGEANTRFLIRQGDWSGIVIEANERYAKRIRKREEHWRYDLSVIQASATRENVDDLVASAGVVGEIGVLSIDIDGMDYWIWDALSVVKPAVVVIEYNARLGAERAVTVPYDPAFRREVASPTRIYYGASLAAMVRLGASKGYDYVGSNSADVNAFFVRSDVRPEALPRLSAAEGFRPTRIREMRDVRGRLTFANSDQEAAVLARLPLVEV
jgi:hypothetical protein